MVRFLRNATVAKVAGKESSLLQISSEERERVGRVADLLGEEDLTRHLQIMLRTHGELGYKQEQRFHLELGLLKMAHAQRLLPIEQLLSDVAASPGGRSVPRPSPRPAIVGGAASTQEPRRADATPPVRPSFVSPFAADSARKGTPRQETADSSGSAGPRVVGRNSSSAAVVMGSAALATISENAPQPKARPELEPRDLARDVPTESTTALEVEETTEGDSAPTTAMQSPTDPVDKVRSGVLQALSDDNQRILVSMLEAGEWSVQGNELVIKIAESQTVVDMSLGNEARKLAIASASGALGRPVKLKIVPGATVTAQENRRNGSGGSNGPTVGGRSRAEQDPIVQRMREKFSAEIRTVIDYKEKR
jgi:DNA polymerase-3 subunit gamma/tau